MKRCSKCGETKPRSEFYKRLASKDGLCSQCKNCRRIYEQSSKGKAAGKKYQQSSKGKISNAKCGKTYRGTKKGKQAHVRGQVKYWRSIRNKIISKKQQQSPEKKKQIAEIRKQRWSRHSMSAGFPPGTKVCKDCNRLMLFEEFDKNKQAKDGLTTRCRECRVR